MAIGRARRDRIGRHRRRRGALRHGRAGESVLRRALFLLGFFFAGCGLPVEGPTPGERSGQLVVVATTGVLGDFARHVGGDRVRVEVLVPADADPHGYQPTTADTERVRSADLVLLVGAGLETIEVEDLIYDSAPENAPIIPVGESVVLSSFEDNEDAPDPHSWMDAEMAVRLVEVVLDGLSEIDESNRPTYEENAARYIAELRALDRFLTDQIATIPAERRQLVTDHDAYGYLARRYGLALVGALVESPQDPADPARADALVASAQAAGLRAVFVEPLRRGGVLEQAARRAGLEARPLHADSFAAGADGYIGTMRKNAEELVAALR